MATENPREPGRAEHLSDANSRARLESLIRGGMNAVTLAHKLAMLDIEAKHRLALYHSHYNPNQPRVPAGHPDGGRWTSAGGALGTRLAGADKPGRGLGSAILAALLHLTMSVIEATDQKKGCAICWVTKSASSLGPGSRGRIYLVQIPPRRPIRVRIARPRRRCERR
jgi:hypothetical protein